MAVVFLITTTTVLWTVWWCIQFFKFEKYLAGLPGPWPLPLIGIAHRVTDLIKIIPLLSEYQNDFGSPFKIMLLHKILVVGTDQKTFEWMLSSNVLPRKSDEYKYFESWFGMGLIHSWGAQWKMQRKLLNPAFHSSLLEQFIPIFNSQTDVLINKLQQLTPGDQIDITLPVTLCTLDIICETTMGTDVNAQNDPNCKYVQSGNEMFRIAMDRVISPFKMWDALYVLSKDYWKEKKILRYLHEYRDSVIARRRTEITKTNSSGTSSDSTVKKKFALLDLLLQCEVAGQPLPDEDIRAQVDTFIVAGHDTTASAVSFTIYCLSQNPEVQEKAVNELRTIFSEDYKRSPSSRDLQGMVYLEMVIKESLRLYPPVPMISRSVDENIKFNNSFLPKGTTMLAYIFGLHRQPDVFPNPEKFDPERFSPENSYKRSPYAFMPFSNGPRNCIGQRFAMLELKVIISKILSNFELLPVQGHKPILQGNIVLQTVNGLPIILKPRQL